MQFITKYLILIFVVINFSAFAQKQDTIIIKPGIGIDNIKLGKSSIGKVRRYFCRKNNIRRISGQGCAKPHIYWSRGMRIEKECINTNFRFQSKKYYTRYKFHYLLNRKLKTITLSNITNAKLENGIAILKSTRQEIMKVYGNNGFKEGEWDEYSVLNYSELGIMFDFDENDILFEVEIFKPVTK